MGICWSDLNALLLIGCHYKDGCLGFVLLIPAKLQPGKHFRDMEYSTRAFPDVLGKAILMSLSARSDGLM